MINIKTKLMCRLTAASPSMKASCSVLSHSHSCQVYP